MRCACIMCADTETTVGRDVDPTAVPPLAGMWFGKDVDLTAAQCGIDLTEPLTCRGGHADRACAAYWGYQRESTGC